MSSSTVVFLWKLGRFFLGLAVTVLSGYLGYLRGKSMKERGITGESFSRSHSITLGMFLRDTVLVLAGIYGLHQLDRKFAIFSYFSRFLHQFGLVAIRSVLVFLFASQWLIWEDKTRLKRAGWIIGIAILIMTVVELILLCPATVLVGEEEIEPRSGVVLQTCSISCGPASLVNVMRVYGSRATEREAVLAMEIGLGGSFDDEFLRGATAMGFPDARSGYSTLGEIASIDLPIIVNLEYFNDWRNPLHAVALLGISSDTVTIADPLIGLRILTKKDFLSQWKGPAIHLGIPSFAAENPPRLSRFDPDRFKRLSLTITRNRDDPRAGARHAVPLRPETR